MARKFQLSRRLMLTGTMCAWSLAMSAGFATVAHASDSDASYPNKAITIVDGFAPGGSTDVLARILGQHLSKAFDQPIVIENKAGAGGIVATTYVARAKNDGYTLLLGTIGPIVVNPHVMTTLSYKPLEDLTPVFSLVDVANVMVVQSNHPAKNVEDLIKLAKEKPDSIKFGSAGIGTTAHLAGEVFQQEAGVTLTHVPYRGGAPSMTGLLGGETDLIFSSIPTAVEHIQSGRLRALGITGSRELSTLPGIKPLKDTGIEKYELPSWYGIFAPAGTPQPVIAKLEKQISIALDKPEVKAQLIRLGMVPNPIPAAEFKTLLIKDSKYWQGVLQRANISLN